MSIRRSYLSRFVVPKLFIGNQELCNENMMGGQDRLEYLEGLVAHLNTLLASGRSPEEVRRFHAQVPFGSLVTLHEAPGHFCIQEHPQARSAIAFRPDELTTMFLDGRKRRASEMVALQSGTDTPGFSRLVSRLCWGAPIEELLDLAQTLGLPVDSDFFDHLRTTNVIEDGSDGPRTAPQFLAAQLGSDDGGCRVTWLGHAAVVLQCRDTTLWIDPYLFPVIRWQEEERAQNFAAHFADSTLLSPYGPECAQLSAWELPKPDAILVTHQDVDHYVPGVLMGAPETTTVVVPKPVASEPVDIDLSTVTKNLFGSRPVRTLAHSESMQIGPFKVTAFPFGGEVPSSMTHGWNCYLVETEDAAVALTADSGMDAPQIEFLISNRKQRKGDFLLMARTRSGGDDPWPGYRDDALELFTRTRLWGWYCRPIDLFLKAVRPGISRPMLTRLVKEAGLSAFFPYATGSLPWFRFSESSLFAGNVQSLTVSEFRQCEALAQAAGVPLAPLQYGIPYALRGRESG
jgi:L-ascorbate metabolism protein UlaG (beta-lactamase superfamily)